MGNKVYLIQQIKNILQKEFAMTDEGEIHYILENATLRNRLEAWSILHQQKYFTSKLEEYNMLNCNHSSTPMPSCLRLSKDGFNPTT